MTRKNETYGVFSLSYILVHHLSDKWLARRFGVGWRVSIGNGYNFTE
jgi:hypothetical protein